MRRYDDPVGVRRDPGSGLGDGPGQFLWRGSLWQVRAVLAHWVETGPWWQSRPVRAVIGTDQPMESGESGVDAPISDGDLLTERELWRVEAGRPGRGAPTEGTGVFDLSFDWRDGRWLLVGCAD